MSNAPCELFRCRAESRKSAGPGSVMISTPNQSGGPLAAGADTASATDPYILTLCCLAGPVTIRPPRAPQFKPFTFFTSRSRQADGSERVLLHMGYFATQKLAQKWAKLLRGPYPQAIATRAPAALLQRRDSAAPTFAPANATRTASPVMPSHHAPASDNALTDTQVFGILETRRVEPVGGGNHRTEGRRDFAPPTGKSGYSSRAQGSRGEGSPGAVFGAVELVSAAG